LVGLLQQTTFSHVSWDGNNVLAVMAKENENDFLVWVEDIPISLEHVIQSEQLSFNDKLLSFFY
jgi:hypothetical protein